MTLHTKFLNVRSQDRDAGSSSSSSFKYTLPTAIKKPKRIDLISLELPLQVHNVRTGYNTFQWTEGTVRTATVASGSYNVADLLTALQVAMTAVTGSTYTFAVNTTTLRLTLTSSASVTIGDTNLSRMLGFVQGQSGTSVIATNSYSISSHDSYYMISLNNMPSNFMCKNIPCTFKLIVSVDTGYILFHNTESLAGQHVDVSNIDQLAWLDISLYDMNALIVPLNGLEWSMTLAITYEEEETRYH
jgi:hypothetical protein